MLPTLPDSPTTTSTTSTTTRATSASTSTTTSTTIKGVEVEAKERKCVNTTESAPVLDPDWASYWTTQPDPNYPVELALCVDDFRPKAGQPITLGILARDTDMKITNGQCDVRVTWEGSPPTCREGVSVEPKRAPDEHKIDAKTKNQITFELKHTYEESGERTIIVRVWSGPDDGKRHTYASYNSMQITIEVHK